MIGTPSYRSPHVLVALGSRSCSQLREVGGGSPVDLRNRVSIMAQRGGMAAAMAEASRGVAQVESRREQLARWVVPQPFDVELYSRRSRKVAGLVGDPVRIP